jgi:hypothetical protein
MSGYERELRTAQQPPGEPETLRHERRPSDEVLNLPTDDCRGFILTLGVFASGQVACKLLPLLVGGYARILTVVPVGGVPVETPQA